MKKVIKGAVYDTSTAKKIGEYDNGLQRTDFAYYEETLYRTKSGKYFVYGWGHANSKYGEWHGNSGGSGEEIRPYTYQEAVEWAEEYLSGEDYEAAFGVPDEGYYAQTISIPYEIKYKLDKLQSETGKSISQIVIEAINKAGH